MSARLHVLVPAILAAVPLVGLLACAPTQARKPGTFAHVEHPSQITNCGLCHRPVGTGSHYLVPGDSCKICHDEAKEPLEGELWVPRPERFERRRVVGVFHHGEHIGFARTRKLPADECTDCHGGIAQSAWNDPYDLPAMDDCMGCHFRVDRKLTEGKALTGCDVCHVPGDFSDAQFAAIREAILAGKDPDDADIPPSHLEWVLRERRGEAGDGGDGGGGGG